MRRIYIIFCMFFLVLSASAVNIAEADSAYAREDYDQAATLYQELLQQGESAMIYYNLGNCYYRKDEIARAVLYYEKAHLLDPGDADIRFNLALAQSKTVDKIAPESEMFFVTWYKIAADRFSADGWAALAVSLFVLALLCCALYLFSSRMLYKKIGFFAALFSLLLVVLFHTFASVQRTKLSERNSAIVMVPSVAVKSTPSDSGTDLFVIHEGTKVEILDDSMKDWKEVRLADGKQGWVSMKLIERI